ncbi:MAG: hypothetical protein HRU19_30900 [Pseudobacteriovorax sp.]|nr:hypothetical protein [Pseudobacteriovorax sp.]
MNILKSTLILSVLLLSACGDNSFSGSPQKKTVEPEKPQEPVAKPKTTPIKKIDATESAVEVFSLETQKSPLDMVWVIDNSGSMSEEAEQVRNNFKKFTASVEDATNLNLALISRIGSSGTNMELEPSDRDKGYIELDQEIGSWNSLALLAAATCPVSTTDVSNGFGNNIKVCNINSFGDNTSRAFGKEDELTEIRGKLQSFYRPEATKVFVVVTDDDATAVNHEHITQAFVDQGIKPIFYSFSGSGSSSCSIASTGTSYIELAKKTNGAVFDICENDWTQHFEQLKKSVISKTNANFELASQPMGSSVKVQISGKEIPKDKFTITGKTITIDQILLEALETDTKIIISYERQI